MVKNQSIPKTLEEIVALLQEDMFISMAEYDRTVQELLNHEPYAGIIRHMELSVDAKLKTAVSVMQKENKELLETVLEQGEEITELKDQLKNHRHDQHTGEAMVKID